jgi:hypothetical protein
VCLSPSLSLSLSFSLSFFLSLFLSFSLSSLSSLSLSLSLFLSLSLSLSRSLTDTHTGNPGVITGEREKVLYIDTLVDFMRRNCFHWAEEAYFVSEKPAEMREQLCRQMMRYRRERKEPREDGWQDTKTRIFGKAHGHKDDLMLALQIALYWFVVKTGDPRFRALCERNGWVVTAPVRAVE